MGSRGGDRARSRPTLPHFSDAPVSRLWVFCVIVPPSVSSILLFGSERRTTLRTDRTRTWFGARRVSRQPLEGDDRDRRSYTRPVRKRRAPPSRVHLAPAPKRFLRLATPLAHSSLVEPVGAAVDPNQLPVVADSRTPQSTERSSRESHDSSPASRQSRSVVDAAPHLEHSNPARNPSGASSTVAGFQSCAVTAQRSRRSSRFANVMGRAAYGVRRSLGRTSV